MPITRTFTVTELADIDALYAKDVNVLNEVEEVDDHGTSLKRCIFLHDGRHWEIYYSSHGQNGITWDDDEVTATAVEERQVTVTRWLPVEADPICGDRNDDEVCALAPHADGDHRNGDATVSWPAA